MKEIAFLLLAFANLIVGCVSAIGLTISATLIYHHWTIFHFVMIALSIITCAASATLALEKASNTP